MVYEKFTKAAGFNRWHDMVPMVSTSQLSYADSIDIGGSRDWPPPEDWVPPPKLRSNEGGEPLTLGTRAAMCPAVRATVI